MSLQVVSVQPGAVLSIFARLYGCGEQDLVEMADQMTGGWIAQDENQDVMGVIGLRPSPAHGAEIVGGAFPGPTQPEAALALLQAAVMTQSRLYAYGEAHLLPEEALAAAGLAPVSAYTRLTGPLPTARATVPAGFRIVPLSEVSDLADRLAAQQTYSDRIGHTPVTTLSVQPGAGGSDDTLSRLAYDASGVPAGVCRVWLEEKQATFGTPGVRSDARGTGLRRALLLSACEAARSAGATHGTLEAWGDTEEERAEDEVLGFVVEELNPIYSTEADESQTGQAEEDVDHASG